MQIVGYKAVSKLLVNRVRKKSYILHINQGKCAQWDKKIDRQNTSLQNATSDLLKHMRVEQYVHYFFFKPVPKYENTTRSSRFAYLPRASLIVEPVTF